jgi:hypothetical protein
MIFFILSMGWLRDGICNIIVHQSLIEMYRFMFALCSSKPDSFFQYFGDHISEFAIDSYSHPHLAVG